MIVAGIDEAGYGPRLGPLVVAASAFRLEEGVKEPALNRLLAVSGTGGGLPINDSKLLYHGPETFGVLETSVLGHAVLARGVLPLRVRALLEVAVDFHADEVEELPWYSQRLLPTPLPRRATVDEILQRAARQGELLSDRGLQFVGFWAAPIPEPRFNHLTRSRGSKAWPLFLAAGRLIDTLMASFPRDELLVRVDRHGGRARYGDLLAHYFPLAPIRTVRETEQQSSYRCDFPDRPPVRIEFEVGGDGRRAPVALASVVAKTVRELFMESLNSWFAERVPGVRRTAGYNQDSHRFLRDVASAIHDESIASRLIRVR